MQPDDPGRRAGARMKLIGGDSGRYEHEELVDQVLLGPRRRGRRAPGQLAVEPRSPRCHEPGRTDGSQAVSNPSVEPGQRRGRLA